MKILMMLSIFFSFSSYGDVYIPVKKIRSIEVDGENFLIYIHRMSRSDNYSVLPMPKTIIQNYNPTFVGLSPDQWVAYRVSITYPQFDSSAIKRKFPEYSHLIFGTGELIASNDCKFSVVDRKKIEKDIISTAVGAVKIKGNNVTPYKEICPFVFALNKNSLGSNLKKFTEQLFDKAEKNELISSPFGSIIFQTRVEDRLKIDPLSLYSDMSKSLSKVNLNSTGKAYLFFAYHAIMNREDLSWDGFKLFQKIELLDFLFKNLIVEKEYSFGVIDKSQLKEYLIFDYLKAKKEAVPY